MKDDNDASNDNDDEDKYEDQNQDEHDHDDDGDDDDDWLWLTMIIYDYLWLLMIISYYDVMIVMWWCDDVMANAMLKHFSGIGCLLPIQFHTTNVTIFQPPTLSGFQRIRSNDAAKTWICLSN